MTTTSNAHPGSYPGGHERETNGTRREHTSTGLLERVKALPEYPPISPGIPVATYNLVRDMALHGCPVDLNGRPLISIRTQEALVRYTTLFNGKKTVISDLVDPKSTGWKAKPAVIYRFKSALAKLVDSPDFQQYQSIAIKLRSEAAYKE